MGKARGAALAAGLSTAKITEIRRTSIIGHEDALDAPRARTRTQAAGRRRPSDGGPVAAGLSTAKITELRSKFLSDVAKPRDNSPDRPASDHALSTSGGPPVGVTSAPEPPTHLRSLLREIIARNGWGVDGAPPVKEPPAPTAAEPAAEPAEAMRRGARAGCTSTHLVSSHLAGTADAARNISWENHFFSENPHGRVVGRVSPRRDLADLGQPSRCTRHTPPRRAISA